jgi:subfamily B ATP-binding cassette protein MsbA
MLVQTAMSVAGPWPLKIILDNVVGSHKLSPEMVHLLGPLLRGESKMKIAEAAAVAAVVIALIGATMSYIANYYTTSVGQWVANDLRLKTYHHLQQLSLKYYDTHGTGTLLSTVTADVQTIQGFASSSTLGIIVDMFTIIAMLELEAVLVSLANVVLSGVGLPSAPRNLGLKPPARFGVWVEFTIAES